MTARLRRRREDGERGAVMIEFALVGMLLATMAFGTIEYGYGWRSSDVGPHRRPGRRASVASMGTDNQSDYFALTSIRTNLDSAGLLDGIQRVVIYKADATDGDAPTVCTGTITATTAKCNIYTGDQVRSVAAGQFSATTGCMTAAHRQELLPERAHHRAGHRRLDRGVRAGEAEVAHRLLRRRRLPGQPRCSDANGAVVSRPISHRRLRADPRPRATRAATPSP